MNDRMPLPPANKPTRETRNLSLPALVTVISAALCASGPSAASAQDNPFSFLFGGSASQRGRVRATRHRTAMPATSGQEAPLPPPRPHFASDDRPASDRKTPDGKTPDGKASDHSASDRPADLNRTTRTASGAGAGAGAGAQGQLKKAASPQPGTKSEKPASDMSVGTAPAATPSPSASSGSPDKADREEKRRLSDKSGQSDKPGEGEKPKQDERPKQDEKLKEDEQSTSASVPLPPRPPASAASVPASPAPLPPEKPADLAKTPPSSPATPPAQATAPAVAPSGATTAFTPRQPTEDLTCFNRLDGLKATFEKTAIGPQPDARCTVVQPVKLTGMALPDGSTVVFPDKPTVACVTADAFAAFVHDLLAPLAKGSFKAPLTKVWTGPGLECRSRDHIFGAKLSAHGQGLAIDIAQIGFADGRTQEVGVPANDAESSFETAARAGACGYFHTVLGPGSDAYHRTHWHFDLEVRGREGDTKFCH